MKTLWKLSVLLILSLSGRSAASQEADEMRLKDVLFSNYDKTGAAETPLNLTVSSSFQRVVDVDPDKGLITVDLWLAYVWTDRRLAWDPNEFNVTGNRIVVPKEVIFLPDMKIYNGFATDLVSNLEVLLYAEGSLHYVSPLRAEVYCDLPGEPFEGHICEIRIGPWSRSSSRLTIWSFHVTNDESQPGGRCTVDQSQGNVVRKIYPCCPEQYDTAVMSLNISCGAKVARRYELVEPAPNSAVKSSVLFPLFLVAQVTFVIFISLKPLLG